MSEVADGQGKHNETRGEQNTRYHCECFMSPKNYPGHDLLALLRMTGEEKDNIINLLS